MAIPNRFWSERDRLFVERLVLGAYRKTYPCIPVVLIDRDATVVDPLLNEAEVVVYKQPLYIPGQIQWSPAQDLLGLYGIERQQDVLVTFPEIALRECNIEPLDTLNGAVMGLIVGDQQELLLYGILEAHAQPQDSWSLQGDITNVAVVSERYTRLSVSNRSGLPIDIYGGFTGDLA